ncbi:MAG: prolyl oligopeptidase family serine peptidase [Tabrizicola sp.]|jgi:polyhydroxybutyrate depolymerase|nr:prolyl oligopeptidase family serine peptidase [Tabrizicola sp.]
MTPTVRARALCLALALSCHGSVGMADCNGAPEPCQLPDGTYHIVVPENATAPIPAILLLHGYGGEGLGTIRNTGMVSQMLQRGYAVIAPDGQPRDGGAGRSWDFHPDRPATRNETAFLIAVAEDATARFGLDRDRMLLAGFSIGGSMASYVACQEPRAFAAYAPVAGSFWRPHPARCAGPVRLLHTHGTADRTVPLTGREIMPGLVQGNVLDAMEIWRIADGCSPQATQEPQGIYIIQTWTGCQPGSDLRFALHEGGHSIPRGWAKLAMDWWETQ